MTSISIARRMVNCGKPTCTTCPHGPYYQALATYQDEPVINLPGLERDLRWAGYGSVARLSQRQRGNWLLAIKLNRAVVDGMDRDTLKEDLVELLEKNKGVTAENSHP